MVEPVTASIIAASIAAAAQGAGAGMSAAASRKAARRQTKEDKRATLADMYNKALAREMDMYKFYSEQGGLNAARRADLLQDAASGFRQSLLGGG